MLKDKKKEDQNIKIIHISLPLQDSTITEYFRINLKIEQDEQQILIMGINLLYGIGGMFLM